MAFPADFYTYRQDLRAFGSGTVISYVPDAALTDLAEGELVGWDQGSLTLKRWLQDAGTPTATQLFVGVSQDSQNTIASLGNQSALSNFLVNKRIGVWTTGVHLLLTKVSDVYTHGLAVYANGNYSAGSGTQRSVTVTQPANGVKIGSVYLPDGSTLTGASGVRVPILIDEFTLKQNTSSASTG